MAGYDVIFCLSISLTLYLALHLLRRRWDNDTLWDSNDVLSSTHT